MPDGWAVDKDGLPTTDPKAALDGGAPMPLGGTRELGGHKGYDLAIFVDILSGVLSGSGFGPHISRVRARPSRHDIGHFFMAFRPDLFIPAEQFKERMDDDDPRAQGLPARASAPSACWWRGSPRTTRRTSIVAAASPSTPQLPMACANWRRNWGWRFRREGQFPTPSGCGAV